MVKRAAENETRNSTTTISDVRRALVKKMAGEKLAGANRINNNGEKNGIRKK